MKTLAKLLHWKPRPRLSFRKLTETAQLPTYATDGAAGLDLYADEDVVIPFLKRALVKTNIAVDLPPGIEGQVRARSGLALKKGMMVLNGPGTIDPDYSGGIGVILFNTEMEDFVIRRGDRIAQLVIASFIRVRPVFTNAEPARETARGAAGFGSTGVGKLAAGGLAMGTLAGATVSSFQDATVIKGGAIPEIMPVVERQPMLKGRDVRIGNLSLDNITITPAATRAEIDAHMERAIAEGLAEHDQMLDRRRRQDDARRREEHEDALLTRGVVPHGA